MTTLVALEPISVSFGAKHDLTDISFSLRTGQILTLGGPNGAGKSTLVRVVLCASLLFLLSLFSRRRA